MSCNRENIIWPAKDGTWNIGFYDFHSIDPGSDDFDYEWDVEYDFERFNWVSTGHLTEEAAWESWDGANPGCSHTILKRDAECQRLDKMVAEFRRRQRQPAPAFA